MATNFLSFPLSSIARLNPYVLLEKDIKGLWKANILGWPDCEARGSTQEEALSNLRQVLAARLEQAEIVPLETPLPNAENPWLRLAGKYKDDPHFDGMLASIETYRRELDAEMELLDHGHSVQDEPT
jgi:predicted RNase H-like HicB family nuclease